MTIINKYKNGNCTVKIYSDGTKIREYSGEPAPIYPESIDVKITNYCDAGCAWCHEKSTIEGQHGDLKLALRVLSKLPRGVEIAIGGGNPLSHPDLLEFLEGLKKAGLIANLTVNAFHIKRYSKMIADIRKRKLAYAFGFSYKRAFLNDILEAVDENTVHHLILGVDKIEDIELLRGNKTKKTKVLLLGYKTFGRGENYYSKLPKSVEDNKLKWYQEVWKYFREKDLVVSFDNLAITQLDLQRFFTKENWNKFYMGDDGQFSMYMDFIEKQFTLSSVRPARDRYAMLEDPKEMFKKVQDIDWAGAMRRAFNANLDKKIEVA